MAAEQAKSLETDILALQKFIDDKKAAKQELNDDEITDLISKIAQIDDKIETNEGKISDIEKVVEGKKQRFADMLPFDKFTRRSKELGKLRGILDERTKIIEDLVKDCTEDINDEKSPTDLKEVCEQVIVECDEHSKRIQEIG